VKKKLNGATRKKTRAKEREREREGFVLFLLIGLLLELGVLVAWGLVNEAKKGRRKEDWCES
jgi:hypothetical protein